MPRRPRVVFVINSIGMGGAERALDTILRAGNDPLTRYEIHLVLLDDEPERRALPTVAGRHCLSAGGSLWRSIRRMDGLLRQLKPDLVVSLLVRANIATALIGPRHARATMLCERMHLGSHLAGRYAGMRHALLRLLPRLVYPRADRVLAVSEGVREDLIHGFGLAPQLVHTVPNGYDLQAIAAAGARSPVSPLPDRYAIAVGRLVAAKNFGLLIEAWHDARPSLPLLILGDGHDRAALQARILALGLGEQVRLLGYLDDPFPVVARAAFLVSPSRNEGFPNAIAEAMALARPIISSDCPSGPAELLGATATDPGVVVEAPFGLLVPVDDRAALAEAIVMMDDPVRRDRLGAAARQRMESFRVERVVADYWSEIDALLGRAVDRT